MTKTTDTETRWLSPFCYADKDNRLHVQIRTQIDLSRINNSLGFQFANLKALAAGLGTDPSYGLAGTVVEPEEQKRRIEAGIEDAQKAFAEAWRLERENDLDKAQAIVNRAARSLLVAHIRSI